MPHFRGIATGRLLQSGDFLSRERCRFARRCVHAGWMLLALVVSASTTGAVLADSHLVQVAVAERGDATVERIRRDLENAFLLTRILATGNGAGSFSLGGPLRITDLRDSQSDYRVYLPQVVWNDAQSDLRAQLGNITIDVEVLSPE